MAIEAHIFFITLVLNSNMLRRYMFIREFVIVEFWQSQVAVYVIQLLSVTIMYSGFVKPIGSNLLKKACPEPNLQLKPCFLRPERDENIDC